MDRALDCSAGGLGSIPGFIVFDHSKMSRNNRNNKDEEEEDIGYYLKEIGWFALKTALLAGGLIIGTKAIVSSVGFRAVGVAAGTLASAYQSANAKQGNVIERGSTFSKLQSIGQSGLPTSAQAAIGIGSAALVGLSTLKK